MNPMHRRNLLIRGSALAGGALLLPHASRAASYPTRPVRVIVPQAPGGAADQMIRAIASRLETQWVQSVLIDYKPGGGSVLATQAVLRSAPDGYTLGTCGSSLSINALLRKDLPYKLSDVQLLSRIGFYTTVLVAHPTLPANNVRELIALARQQPPLYGSNGVGSAAHLAGELLNHMGGISMQHVPYNGASKMYTDMLGGRLPLGFAIATSAEPFVKSGQLKVLGVTNAARSQLYPQWPAVSETLPGYEAVNWAGIFGPTGMPQDVVDQLSTDLLKAVRNNDTRKALIGMGVDVVEQSAGDFAAFVKVDGERIGPLTKKIGPLE